MLNRLDYLCGLRDEWVEADEDPRVPQAWRSLIQYSWCMDYHHDRQAILK